MGKSVEVKVESIMGDLHLYIGDSLVELSIKQARELADLLHDAAEHAAEYAAGGKT